VKRGDVVTVAAGSGFGGKPRPALVLQGDRYDDLGTVVVAPFTTELAEAQLLRLRIAPDEINGLEQRSDLMLHVLVTARRERIGKVIGRLSGTQLAEINRVLLTFLGLAE